MWSHTEAAENNTWCPNHFVPLLSSTAPDREAFKDLHVSVTNQLNGQTTTPKA